MILVLFGVSGAGKTTIGHAVSSRLGWEFLDGDDYHSEANRRKMRAGIPLTDAEREPWLRLLHERMQDLISRKKNAILACSALKQKYRDLLTSDLPREQVQFALLDAPRELLRERIQQRQHEYMNPSLLDSQLETLEVPDDTWIISVRGDIEQAVNAVLVRMESANILRS